MIKVVIQIWKWMKDENQFIIFINDFYENGAYLELEQRQNSEILVQEKANVIKQGIFIQGEISCRDL